MTAKAREGLDLRFGTRRRVMYFSPENDVQSAVLRAAAAAQMSLHVMIYGFTLGALADILIVKHQTGLATGVLSDRTQAAGKTQRAMLQRLAAAGVPVTLTSSDRAGAIMHDKVLLVDVAAGVEDPRSFAAYGSYNLSASAAKQANHWATDNDPAIVAAQWARYQRLEAHGRAKVKQGGII